MRSSAPLRRPLNFPLFFDSSKLTQECSECKDLETVGGFQIPQQARRFSFAGAKVQIYQALDGRVAFYYGDTRLEHAAIPGGDSFMLPLG